MKNAIVTGCGGQLGVALVEMLVDHGFFVFGLDKSIVKSEGKNYSFFQVDITSEDETASFFEYLAKNNIKINALVNNAGIGVFSSYEERSKYEFMKVLEVNLFGTFNMIKSSVAFFDERSSPSNIVNISSVYGIVSSDPFIYEDLNRKNSEVYSASKAGVIQMTKYFAVHLAEKRITVNTVSPGGIFNKHPTKFLNNYSKKCPMGRMANVKEVASAITFFCENKSEYLTGQNLAVDGGLTAW